MMSTILTLEVLYARLMGNSNAGMNLLAVKLCLMPIAVDF